MSAALPITRRPKGPRSSAWHQTLKNRILLEHYYLPGDLERQVAAFVAHYNHARYHESFLGNLTPWLTSTSARAEAVSPRTRKGSNARQS